MNELTLAIKQNPGTIEMNFDALEEQLDKKLDEYRGAVFTEDGMARKENYEDRRFTGKRFKPGTD